MDLFSKCPIFVFPGEKKGLKSFGYIVDKKFLTPSWFLTFLDICHTHMFLDDQTNSNLRQRQLE